jgi:hypothetical protein
MRRYNGRLKLQRTVEARLGQQLLRGTRIPAITAYKQKAPEGAFCNVLWQRQGSPLG